MEKINPAKPASCCRTGRETIVVALGGNAILRPGQSGTFPEQMENVRKTAAQLAELILNGKRLVVTHGNGPQVGRIFQQQEIGVRAGIPEMPLFVCGAMSQGQIAVSYTHLDVYKRQVLASNQI